MRIGYFAHWFRPHWSFNDFIREQGFEIEKIDYSQIFPNSLLLFVV